MTPATLLSDLTARGMEFWAHGDKLRYRPVDRMTSEELNAIRQHKEAILALLRRIPPFGMDATSTAEPAPVINLETREEAVCRCGSTAWMDTPIHEGQSIRRDCRRCGRFLGFPKWHGVLDEKTSIQ